MNNVIKKICVQRLAINSLSLHVEMADGDVFDWNLPHSVNDIKENGERVYLENKNLVP